MSALLAWVRFVVTPNTYPERWQDRLFMGHVSFRFLWLWPVTIYGANAMHWAINVWFRDAYWCFHPTTSTFSTKGHKWGWYFYISRDGTPSRATFALGSARREQERFSNARSLS